MPAQAPAPGSVGGGAQRGAARDEDAAAVDAKGSDSTEAPSEIPAAPKVHRLVHYNATAQLRVTSPAASIDQATDLVVAQGGFVEHLAANSIVLRVPVAKFSSVYKALLLLGDVLSKAVEAEDITDAYLAVDLRLQTSTAALNRLVALLAKTRNEREKLDLLREIQRLTEEVDGLHDQLTTLASLADFSRITLTFVPHQPNENQTASDIAALAWIRALSPFQQNLAASSKKLELNLPTDFVRLKDHDYFVAESADQAQIWASRRANTPKGDDAFWVAAVKTRLGPEFASAEESVVGPYHVLRMVDRSDRSYRYLVGVHVEGDKLAVVEIYYPSEEQEKRHHEAVEAALAKGAI